MYSFFSFSKLHLIYLCYYSTVIISIFQRLLIILRKWVIMQIKYLIWSFVILLIGGILSVFLMPFFKRLVSKKWRLYDAWPPVIIVATSVLAASRQIASTGSYMIIDICAFALIYAIYLVIVPRSIKWQRFALIVWRCALLITVFWYVFVLIWVVVI